MLNKSPTSISGDTCFGPEGVPEKRFHSSRALKRKGINSKQKRCNHSIQNTDIFTSTSDNIGYFTRVVINAFDILLGW